MKNLELLIPSYKRPETLSKAVDSVAKQVVENHFEDRVSITVVDDCSPNVDIATLKDKHSAHKKFLSFRKNQTNQGMSLNIRNMVASSQAFYCSILTDDDCLQAGTLAKIIQIIDGLDGEYGPATIAAFYAPRYSYLEDGSLHCVVCDPFEQTTLLEPGSLTSLKHLHDGFILTGLFFQPRLINFPLWDRHIENSFFPVIYFSDLLLKHKCLFVKDNWFIHTVLNECHWESWGATEKVRYERLYRDYMDAVSVAARAAFSRGPLGFSIFKLFREEVARYKQQIYSAKQIHGKRLPDYSASRQLPYWSARFEMSNIIQYLCSITRRVGGILFNAFSFGAAKCF